MPGFGNFGTFVGGPLAGAGGMGTRVGVAFVSLTTDNSGLRRGFSQAYAEAGSFGAKLSTIGRGLTTVGGNLTRYLSIPLIAAGGAAVKMASDFNSAMERVSALATVPQKNVEGLSQTILKLSGRTAQAPVDLANSLFFVASAGLKASEVMPVVNLSAEAATAGMGDAHTIGELLVSTLNAYGDAAPTAASAMDTLTAAIKVGVAEPVDLANSLGTVLPVAAQMGVSFDQVAGAIAAATDQGISAARAATGIRYMLISLERPTVAAEAALKTYGITADQVANDIATKGLIPTVKMLADTFDLTTTAGRQAFFTVLGGVRAGHIALALVGKDYNQVSGVLQRTADAANGVGDSFATAYHKMRRTPAFQFAKAWNDLRIAAIDAGTALLPIATQIVGVVGDIAHGFASLPSPVQSTIVKIGLFAAALGPVLWTVGKLVTVLGAGVTAMEAFGAGWATLNVTEAVGMGAGAFRLAGGQVGNFAQAAEEAAASTGVLSKLSTGLAALPAGAKFGIWAAGVAGLVVAYKKLQDVRDQISQGQDDYLKGLEKGAYGTDQLHTSIAGATADGPLWGKVLINIAADLGLIQTPLEAADAAIRDFTGQVNSAVGSMLFGANRSKGWIAALEQTQVGTVQQRKSVAQLVDAVDVLNLHMTHAQSIELQSLVSTGQYTLAKKLLGQFVSGQLSRSLDSYSGFLDKANQKEVEGALKAKNYAQALRILRREALAQYQLPDYANAVNEAMARQYDALRKKNIVAPDTLFHDVFESTKLSATEGVGLVNLIGMAQTNLVPLGDRLTKQLELAIRTGKGIPQVSKAIRDLVSSTLHARDAATTLDTLTTAVLTNKNAYADWAATLHDRVYAGTLKLPAAAQAAAQLQQAYTAGLGPKLAPGTPLYAKLSLELDKGHLAQFHDTLQAAVDKFHPGVTIGVKHNELDSYLEGLKNKKLPPLVVRVGVEPTTGQTYGVRPSGKIVQLPPGAEYRLAGAQGEPTSTIHVVPDTRAYDAFIQAARYQAIEVPVKVQQLAAKVPGDLLTSGVTTKILAELDKGKVNQAVNELNALIAQGVQDPSVGVDTSRGREQTRGFLSWVEAQNPQMTAALGLDHRAYDRFIRQAKAREITIPARVQRLVAQVPGEQLTPDTTARILTLLDKGKVRQAVHELNTLVAGDLKDARLGVDDTKARSQVTSFLGWVTRQAAFLQLALGVSPTDPGTPPPPGHHHHPGGPPPPPGRHTAHEGGPYERWRRMHEGGLKPDEVPVVLQKGEYVVPSPAVRRIGVSVLDRVTRMHEGGYVSPVYDWMQSTDRTGSRMPEHDVGRVKTDLTRSIGSAIERAMRGQDNRDLVAAVHALTGAVSGMAPGSIFLDGYRVDRGVRRGNERRVSL